MKPEFTERSRHVQAWIISMIVSWDDFDKITTLLEKYVGIPTRMKLYQKDIDTFFTAWYEKENRTLIAFDGTKNAGAWISDFIAIGGKFHQGIKSAMDDVFMPAIKTIEKLSYVMSTGQSRGGADALYANYLLRKAGLPDVESWNFSGPYITTPEGKEACKRLGVRHTNFLTDAFSHSLPSDPTDEAGVLHGDHYGPVEQLLGGSSVFDHSYLNMTKNLIYWLLQPERVNDRFIEDAKFLANLIRHGNDLIKK